MTYLTYPGKAIREHFVFPRFLNDAGFLTKFQHNTFIGKCLTRFPAVCLGPPTLSSVY